MVAAAPCRIYAAVMQLYVTHGRRSSPSMYKRIADLDRPAAKGILKRRGKAVMIINDCTTSCWCSAGLS